jgi:hypothetical protein
MTARAARVRQLELGPFVRMSARRGLTVSRVGVAYTLERQTIVREIPYPLTALSDSGSSFTRDRPSASKEHGSTAHWKRHWYRGVTA